ncbi:MAG: MMPL family transporter, partial [Dehalococcoidia bacterium]|nr:MMPL family transporter [Dehalococcoidia bacterium]
NLLSIGAAYGVLVAIFQWGWLSDFIGTGGSGPIESFLPMMLFAVLFGLSMDYEVFLLSRIRENYVHGMGNSGAITAGVTQTARVISAAAAIMVAVFLSFALSEGRIIKEFGIGLGTAILLDATVVRLILVPAVMELLGDVNWWFPRWLDRILPKVQIEGSHESAAAATTDS